MSKYIVIEVREKESALEIMNILMTHTKTRFTCTNDILEYATEREKLQNSSMEQPPAARKQPSPPPQSSMNQQHYMEPPPSKRPAPTVVMVDDVVDIKPIPVFNNPPPMAAPSTFHPDNSMFNTYIPTDYSHPPDMRNFPPTTSDRVPMQTLQPNGKLGQSYQCTLCNTYIKVRGFDYYKRGAHAIIHTDIMRYECTEPGCQFRVRHRADMARHMKVVHGMEVGDFKVRECMTEADQATLRDCVNVCFPEMADRVVAKRIKRDNPKSNEGGSDQDDMDEDYDIDDSSIH